MQFNISNRGKHPGVITQHKQGIPSTVSPRNFLRLELHKGTVRHSIKWGERPRLKQNKTNKNKRLVHSSLSVLRSHPAEPAVQVSCMLPQSLWTQASVTSIVYVKTLFPWSPSPPPALKVSWLFLPHRSLSLWFDEDIQLRIEGS